MTKFGAKPDRTSLTPSTHRKFYGRGLYNKYQLPEQFLAQINLDFWNHNNGTAFVNRTMLSHQVTGKRTIPLALPLFPFVSQL